MSRPHPRDYFDNWRRSDASLPAKGSIALGNILRRVRTRSTCCGNHGQPGC